MTVHQLPEALYKYLTPERTASVLTSLQIRFSQPSVLNDARELKPSFKGFIGPSDEFKGIVFARLGKSRPGLVEMIDKLFSPEERAALLDEVMSVALVQTEGQLPATVQHLYDELDRNFGVLSLSASPTDELLWGYYGDGGYGFLIEFDPQHKWFWAKVTEHDDFRHLRPVEYVQQRVPKYMIETQGTDILYTKSDVWSHEQEWRIFRNFNDAAAKGGVDRYGKEVLLFAIPPDCITSIVIGYRASAQHIGELKRIILGNASLEHIQFHRTVLDGEQIRLVL